MTNVTFQLDGQQIEVPDDTTLLVALRERLGVRSVKDGCSPQGQCGCCTVLVDGSPRVACVTPVRRVAGRRITTVAGFDSGVAERWAEVFCETGASQCGFCTPGIIVRLEGLRRAGRHALDDENAVGRALGAHLCRCTGWRTVLDAAAAFHDPAVADDPAVAERDLVAASLRAAIEGGTPQQVAPGVSLGRGGFADDVAPADALVAVPGSDGDWIVRDTLVEALAVAGKVQGRRTTLSTTWPLEFPDGDWAVRVRTTWCEPAPLEPDASWCRPGGDPASPLANGGDFGAKRASDVASVARRLADEHGRPVRVLVPREWVVRRGPKRPPVAIGVAADGVGVMRCARTPGLAERMAAIAPWLRVDEVGLPGPATSIELRAVGWVEAELALTALTGAVRPIVSPEGARALATLGPDGAIEVSVACGRVLDAVVLRSYVIGAAHMALSWLTSESLVVDDEGEIHDLTIRSFGILRAADTPPIRVTIDHDDDREPMRGSDAAFVAVACAVHAARGCPESVPYPGVPT